LVSEFFLIQSDYSKVFLNAGAGMTFTDSRLRGSQSFKSKLTGFVEKVI
jgi:hypothetical protein